MKKIILSLCFVLFLAVFACSASADIAITSSFSADSPTFGSDDQDASNPNLDDDDNDYHQYVTGTVSVSNNGTSNVTIDSISVTEKMTFDTDEEGTNNPLNITLKNPVTVGAGSTANVELEARIPAGLDAVNSKQEAVAFNVADISLKSGSSTVASFSSFMQRENKLEIKDIDVVIGDDTQSISDEDDEVEDVKPGDRVTLKIKAKNTFKDDDDVEIDADGGQWEIYGDVDEEDDLDFGDLGAGDESDEEDGEFDFKVGDDVDEDDYKFEIIVSGEDEFGAKHGERLTTKFNVNKNRHEIKINDIKVMPTSLDCGDSFTVKVDISNIGQKNEDEVSIRIENSDLNIDSWKTNIDLDNGDETTKTFDLSIPSDAETGSKAFTVTAYYDYNEETDRDTFNIEVSTCGAGDSTDSGDDSTDSGDDGSDDTTSQGDTTTSPLTGGTATAQPTQDSTPSAPAPITTVRSSKSGGFRSSTVYILLLILAIVIVVLVGALLIAKMLIAGK
jgi:hypothetical protein